MPARQAPRAAAQRATQRIRRVEEQQRRAVRQRQAVQRRRGVPARRIQRGVELQRAARRDLPVVGREPESYEAYVRRRTAEARGATLSVATRAAALDGLWSAALASPLHVSFGSLRRRATAVPFDAGGLDVPLPAPRPENFQPAGTQLPEWVPGQRAARERARAAAYAEYRQAVADHRAAEFSRVRRLSVARLEHQRREAAARAGIDEHNAAVDRLQAGYRERIPAAVEEFARIVLSTRSWPEGVRLHWRLRYRPDYCQIDGECVLPAPDVVPGVRRYRYLAAADAIRRQFVPAEELRQRYQRLVEQIALVSVFDLFSGLAPDLVDVVQLSGRLAGGGPHLVSVAVARAEWDAQRPWTDPPASLLDRLDARVSPDAHAGAPVVPWADLDA
jgi:hypothetical protein